MLAISSTAGRVPGISAWGLRGPVAGSVRSQNTVSNAGRYADAVDIPLTRQELLAMAGGADESGRAGNALLTAHDALGVIGGLLGNVQAVLSAASSHDPSFDPQTDQSRIDSAVWTIDAIASSTKFGGQHLLDGTFNGAGIAIPSYSSRELGMDKTAAQSDPLATLVSGASNDLASGHLAAAEQILTSAMSQVTTTQSRIVERQNSSPAQPPALPPGVSAAELMTTAASELLVDPALSAVAVANSSAQNVFALLRG